MLLINLKKKGCPFENGQPVLENLKASTKLIDYRLTSAFLANFKVWELIQNQRLSILPQ